MSAVSTTVDEVNAARSVDPTMDTSTMMRYSLTQRGLFSEINNLIMAYVYAYRNGHGFEVDSSSSSLYFSLGFEHYFEPVKIECRAPVHHVMYAYGVGSKYFYLVRQQHISFTEKRQFATKIIRYRDPIAAEIQDMIDGMGLPPDYFVFHIRRGDKLLAEAKRHAVAKYFANAGTADVKNLFVMTDNFAVIDEVRRYMSSTETDSNLYYLRDQSLRGFNNESLLRRGVRFDRNKVIRLLAEIEVAKGAHRFIGTFSSNVSRYVKLVHRQPDCCLSLDEPWVTL